MPNYQCRARRRKIVFAVLLVLVIALVACSTKSDADTATATPEAPPTPIVGSYETCTGFLNAQNVESLTGKSDLVDRQRIIDIAGAPELTESGALNNCLVEVFKSVEGSGDPLPGSSLSLSIVNFSSEQLAIDLFDSTLASVLLSVEQIGERAEVQREVIGTDSYLLDIKVGGIGAIIVFVSDTVFVSMSSTTDEQGGALLTGTQLVTAAKDVQTRLPKFAQTRFTGQ